VHIIKWNQTPLTVSARDTQHYFLYNNYLNTLLMFVHTHTYIEVNLLDIYMLSDRQPPVDYRSSVTEASSHSIVHNNAIEKSLRCLHDA
jgi:hypothetical protein